MKIDLKDEHCYHIGNHYSTSAFIYYYLMRLYPYLNNLISLQSGSLENPNRTFMSLSDTETIFRNSNDCRELIPEFYTMIEHYINLNCCYFGYMYTDSLVDDVVMNDNQTASQFVEFLL